MTGLSDKADRMKLSDLPERIKPAVIGSPADSERIQLSGIQAVLLILGDKAAQVDPS